MKRFFCLLAALLLLSQGAGAEEASPVSEVESRTAELVDLWLEDGGHRTWITAAAPVADGILLTSPALLPERTDGLTASDGEQEWKIEAVIPDSTGLVAMVFFNTERTLPRVGFWPLMAIGSSVQASTCLMRSGSADGGRTDSRVRSAETLVWQNCRCLLLDSEEPAPLGSPVLNARGELAGLVVAEYAEGRNRMLALPAEEIVRGISEAVELLKNLVSWGNPPEGLRVTAYGNTVTFDWSGVSLPDHADGEQLYMVIADLANAFLNYWPAEAETRKQTLILTPGRVYVSGFVATGQTPSELPQDYKVTVIPPARKLTDYAFRPTLTAVAEMPEDAAEGDRPVPVKEVTEDLLRSGRAYFYSASAYEVKTAVGDISLLVTLTDPQGNNYRYESTWIYAPEYMKEDIWYIPLTGTGLTWSLDRNGYPPGEYQLAYYVDGKLADTITFELK